MKDKYLCLNIGFACNNNCRFCFDGLNRALGNRKIEDIKKDLEENIKRCEEVILDGEITIMKDAFDIISHAKKTGYKSIQIQSNGRMFASKNFCNKVSNSGVTSIMISLHGSNPETHDYLTRTPGSFKQTIQGIKNLVQLKQNIFLKMVVTTKNYKEMKKVVQILHQLKVNRIIFSLVRNVGYVNFTPELIPKEEDIVPNLVEAIEEAKNKNINVGLEGINITLPEPYNKHKYNKNDFVRYRIGGNIPIKFKIKIFNLLKKYELHYMYPEFISTVYDIKPAFRSSIHISKLEYFKELCKQFNLYLETSDFDMISCENSTIKKDKTEKNPQRVLVFISKNEETSKKIKNLHESNIEKESEEEIGKLLGYPSCCIKFFIENVYDEKTESKIKKPIYYLTKIKNNSPKQNPFQLNNLYVEYFDKGWENYLISHIPCSFSCKKSQEIAKKTFEIIKEDCEQIATSIKNKLTKIYIFSEDEIKMKEDGKNNPENELIFN